LIFGFASNKIAHLEYMPQFAGDLIAHFEQRGNTLANARNMKARKREDKEYDLWILLSRVYHMVAKLRNMEMNKQGILPVQAYMLFIIHSMGNTTTPAELSRFVYQQRNSVSDILKRMEKQDLITKEKASKGNGRILIRITEKGKKILHLSKQRAHLHNVMSVLNETKREQLESLLESLRDRAIDELSVYQKTVLPPSQLSKYYQE
jgi:DNA-binding MarR family transcriptional regulator